MLEKEKWGALVLVMLNSEHIVGPSCFFFVSEASTLEFLFTGLMRAY